MTENIFFYLIISSAVLIAGISKGGFGGGAAFLSTIIVLTVLAPAEAVALMLLVFIFMDQMSIYAHWKKWDFAILRPLLWASLIGIIFAWLTFDYFDATAIKLLIVLFVILFWLIPLLPLGLLPHRVRAYGGVIAAILSGFSSGIANAGGPPITAYLIKAAPSKSIFQGCSVFFFWWINLAKLPVFIALELYSFEMLKIALFMVPLSIVGVYIGVWVNKFISEKTFKRIMNVFLFFAIIQLCYSGIVDIYPDLKISDHF